MEEALPDRPPVPRMPIQSVDKYFIFNKYQGGRFPAFAGGRLHMKIKWLLCATAGIVALMGAQPGDQSAAAKPPVVRAVEFKNFRGVSVKEIVSRLNDRDIQLVERPYSAEYVETAQGIVEELLAEKGQQGTHVKPTVTTIPPHSVRVTFTAAP
jgi:hypothetical protein